MLSELDRRRIEDSLRALLTRGAASVHFSDEASGKFVQAYANGGRITTDLPIQALDTEELSRAGLYFSSMGVELRGVPLFEQPGETEPVRYQYSFNVSCVQDAALAARVVEGVFREVYEIQDITLLVRDL